MRMALDLEMLMRWPEALPKVVRQVRREVKKMGLYMLAGRESQTWPRSYMKKKQTEREREREKERESEREREREIVRQRERERGRKGSKRK